MQREPTRRDALRVGAVGFGASLTGCMTTLGIGTKTDQGPEKEQLGTSVYYTWKDGNDKKLLVLGINSSPQKSNSYLIPLRFQVWHQDGTHLDSLKFKLKPRANFGHPVIMYWETPNRYWPKTDFFRTETFGMVFEVPHFGEYGSGTVTSEFIAEVPTNEETINTLPLRLTAEFELSEGVVGGYDLSLEDTFEIPVQRDQ